MVFLDTVDTILNWINSCQTEPQLYLCRDAIEKFIVERFKNHVSPQVLAVNQTMLECAILEQKDKIGGHGLALVV